MASLVASATGHASYKQIFKISPSREVGWGSICTVVTGVAAGGEPHPVAMEIVQCFNFVKPPPTYVLLCWSCYP